MTGWLLAAGGGVCFAALDAIRKRLVETVDTLSLLLVLSVGNTVIYGAWVALTGPKLDLNAYAPVGAPAVILQLAANLLLLKALEVSDLSRTIPFLALTPVLSGFAGQVALGQLPNALQWTGIAAVSIGAGLLAFVRSGPGDGAAPADSRSLAVDRGSLMALGTAVLWSATAALDKLAIDASNAAMHALLQAAGITVILGVALAARGDLARLRSLRSVWRGCLWAVGFGAAALAFQFMAIERIWVSLMETIKRATGAVSSLVVGRIWFDETIDRGKVAAVLLIVAGTALSLLP